MIEIIALAVILLAIVLAVALLLVGIRCLLHLCLALFLAGSPPAMPTRDDWERVKHGQVERGGKRPIRPPPASPDILWK